MKRETITKESRVGELARLFYVAIKSHEDDRYSRFEDLADATLRTFGTFGGQSLVDDGIRIAQAKSGPVSAKESARRHIADGSGTVPAKVDNRETW